MKKIFFPIKKKIKYLVILFIIAVVLLTSFGISVTSFDDSFSTFLRKNTEYVLNGYIKYLADKGSKGGLNRFDKAIINIGILSGVALTRFVYPEGSKILYHYVHGDGSTLELSSDYFKKSKYLQNKINQLGNGEHGPIALRQSQDWRLSMALNPFFLIITQNHVRIYHPNIVFAPVRGKQVHTIFKLGLLRLKVYDNLVSALNTSSFYVYSEWKR